jgi:DNA-binding CsgD family transcriptional regulator
MHDGAAARRPPPTPKPATDDLLERADEVAAIAGAVARTAAGQAGLLVVEGAAGIGKSRLLAEARRRAAAAGLAVLRARGSEMERAFPFGVVRQLAEAEVADPAAGGRLLTGAAAGARAVFDAPGGAGVPAEDASFATLHALYWLVANRAAEGPLLIAVDDLHWCDRPSLRFLAYLVRRLEGLPVLVAGSMRPADPGADQDLLDEIARDPLAESLRPSPLGGRGTAALIAARLGEPPDEAFLRACREATGGNPLLLTELLRSVAVEGLRPDAAHVAAVAELGPRAVRRAVLVRLARMDDDAVRVAHAAAVLGEGAEMRHVAALAGLDPARAERGADALAGAEVLRPEFPIGFVHPLVREAVYHDLPPGERTRMHGRAVEVLRAAGAADEQVAAHVLRGPPGGAGDLDTLERAAARAVARGAAEGAVAYLRRALEEPVSGDRRTGLLLRLGLAEELVDGPASVAHLREAYAATPDPAARAGIALALGQALLFVGEGADVVRLLDDAAAPLGPGDSDLVARLRTLRLSLAFLDPRAVPIDDPAFVPLRSGPAGDGVAGLLLAALAATQWAFTGGPRGPCADLAWRALADGRLAREENGAVGHVAAYAVLMLADRDEGVAAAEEALAEARRRGNVRGMTPAYGFGALGRLRRGELAEARAMLEENLGLVREWGYRSVEHQGWATLAEVLVESGDVAAARAALDDVGAPTHLPPNVTVLTWLNAHLGVLVAEGRDEAALAVAEEIRTRFPGWVNPAWFPWRSRTAVALARLGRRDEALALAREELAHATVWDAPGARCAALRGLGVLEGGDRGLGLLAEAVAVAEGGPARLELAKALVALGSHMRLARRPGDARGPLRRGLELAVACGAAALAARAREELHAAGARPRTDALSGAAALTASERRVAGMAASGRSNRDIAQELYVTAKTVEVHLSSAYRKLGIRSRRELAGALAGAD